MWDSWICCVKLNVSSWSASMSLSRLLDGGKKHATMATAKAIKNKRNPTMEIL
jgi:hypothetical protein